MTNDNIAFQNRIRNIRFLFVDEISMISQKHFHAMHVATQRTLHAMRLIEHTDRRPFGGINVTLLGDFNQHAPIRQCPSYASPKTRESKM